MTTEIPDPGDLIPLANPLRPLLWLRRDDGLVGIGEALRLEFTGSDRINAASTAWRHLVDGANIDDEVQLPGTGLIASGCFGFSAHSTGSSLLIVPKVVVGRRNGRSWVSVITENAGDTAAAPLATPLGDPVGTELSPGGLPPADYQHAVQDAVKLIRGGVLSKVVLARTLQGQIPATADRRRIVNALAREYPSTWTFAVAGLIGSSPETLVSVKRGRVHARVLAGTSERGSDSDTDRRQAEELMLSVKETTEHAFAVESALAALRGHGSDVRVTKPFPLKLPNLWHLATDIDCALKDSSSALDVVGAMHPTAAVAGTPRDAALALIEKLEPFDRGRYAGPVGWVGSDGSGEWAIALRCAQISETGGVTAYAGCGIVADSVPGKELAESTMKFRPIVEALNL